MKTSLLIIASLIALIKSDCVPSEEELMQLKKLREYEDCASRTSKEELEDTGSYACCHLYFEHDSNNLYKEVDTCTLVTKSEYDNIKSFLKDFEKYEGNKNAKIHCFGFKVQFNILILLIILFLF